MLRSKGEKWFRTFPCSARMPTHWQNEASRTSRAYEIPRQISERETRRIFSAAADTRAARCSHLPPPTARRFGGASCSKTNIVALAQNALPTTRFSQARKQNKHGGY
ncbi:unnamed protein product [Ectocarpus sp. 12 AP-2014]